MKDISQSKAPSRSMTPLWIISLFVSLTEVVTGIAVTQATGNIQIALTVFVIFFPILIVVAFFSILWNRPYVLYPPTEFSSGVDVTQYVGTMKSKVEVVRADFQAEVANIREIYELESRSSRQRIDEMEKFLSDLAKQTQATKLSFKEYKKSIERDLIQTQIARRHFAERSQYRIHVVSVTERPPNIDERQTLASFTNILQKAGYKTSTGGWGSLHFFPKYKETRKSKTIRIIANDNNMEIASHVQDFIRSVVEIPVEICSTSDAIPDPVKDDSLLPKDVDMIIAYCLS